MSKLIELAMKGAGTPFGCASSPVGDLWREKKLKLYFSMNQRLTKELPGSYAESTGARVG